MSRIKRGVTTRARHKKLLRRTAGFRGTRSKLVKVAHEALLHASAYAYAGRRLRKRQLRRSWIMSLSGALVAHGIKYNQFIKGLKDAHITLNRNVLAELATKQPERFKHIVETVSGKRKDKAARVAA